MKGNQILIIYMACMAICSGRLMAQDPHFSQYFATPMLLNPAFTGRGVADWRASAVHRAQWWGSSIAPYTTTFVSLEKSITANAESKSNFAFGLSMLSDASNAGLLKNNYFSFGGAYHVAMDAAGESQLSGGIMATYANRLLDPGKFLFQDQYGSMGYQRSMPSADPVSVMSNKYWDVHAGLSFSRNTTFGGYDVGAAVYHTGRPSEGAYNNVNYSLDPRISLQVGAHFLFGNSDRFSARLLSETQGKNVMYTLGGIYGVSVPDETVKSIDFGLWHRFGDATYPYAGVAGKNWQAGISYDFVISSVKTVYNSVQSLELSLIWQFKKNRIAAKEHHGMGVY